MGDKTLQDEILSHVEKLLEHNMLVYEVNSLLIIISQCKADKATPYALEIIDMLDIEHNHLILTAKSVSGILNRIPLVMSEFTVMPHTSECEKCQEYLNNVKANKAN